MDIAELLFEEFLVIDNRNYDFIKIEIRVAMYKKLHSLNRKLLKAGPHKKLTYLLPILVG